jgi:transcriptional regulator with XRE-family HTH domain
MSFAEVFSDIRRRRRVPMRLFTQRAGLSPSYIHDIERGTTVPGTAKLEAITSVLREVALEQGADPDSDARDLFRAREETIYVERLGIDPHLAHIFIALRELDEQARASIQEPILRAISFFAELDEPTRRKMGTALIDAINALGPLEPVERNTAGIEIAEALDHLIVKINTEGEPLLDDDVRTSDAAPLPSATPVTGTPS